MATRKPNGSESTDGVELEADWVEVKKVWPRPNPWCRLGDDEPPEDIAFVVVRRTGVPSQDVPAEFWGERWQLLKFTSPHDLAPAGQVVAYDEDWWRECCDDEGEI